MKQPLSKLKGSKLGSRVGTLPGLFILLFAAIGAILLIRSFAISSQLRLVPSTTSVQQNQNVTVQVRVSSNDSTIDSVDGTVTYDPAKMQYVSVDATGSAFDFDATGAGIVHNQTNGTLKFARGTLSSPDITTNKDVLVLTLTFKALVGSGTSNLSVAGTASDPNAQSVPITGSTVTLTLTGAVVANGASITIESTNPTPPTGSQFGLKVYVDTTAYMEGGVVDVNLPAGLAYQGTLDTTGTAFNPATTVNGTTSQLVKLVFITQSKTLTGKQLVATIPVIASTTGAKSVSFTNAEVTDINGTKLTTTANPYSITISSPIAKPTVSLTGGVLLGASTDTTDFKQSFTITNFDAAATYAITIGGQTLTQTNGVFVLPVALRNGNHTLQVSITKSGASDSTSHTIRLRSPNVDRIGCVDYKDLSAVNKGYGTTNAEFDLDFNGTVGLIDLLTVTGKWATTCV